jgi:hypothetical protein
MGMQDESGKVLIPYLSYFIQCMSILHPLRQLDSPPTSAKVKKIWIYTSTPPYAFMA